MGGMDTMILSATGFGIFIKRWTPWRKVLQRISKKRQKRIRISAGWEKNFLLLFLSLCQYLNGLFQFPYVLLQGRSHCIEPVRTADEVFHCFWWQDIFNPERDDDNPIWHCFINFRKNVRRSVWMRWKYQHHNWTGINRIDDRFLIIHPGKNISRCYPATDVSGFEMVTYCISNWFIFRWITDKNVVMRWFRFEWWRTEFCGIVGSRVRWSAFG